jgi:hypothetical protein
VRTLIDAALDPYLSRTVILPVCEDTDAITAREDIVQVMFELRERETLIHHLGHLKGRLHIKGDFCDNAQRSKPDYGTCKFVA